MGANSRLVVSPRINNRYEIELRLVTISAMLDPSRNVIELQFLIQTTAGLVEARGTFYAIAEYMDRLTRRLNAERFISEKHHHDEGFCILCENKG